MAKIGEKTFPELSWLVFFFLSDKHGHLDGRLGYVREPVEYFRMVPSPSAASSNLPLEGSKLADLNSNESPSSFHFLKSWGIFDNFDGQNHL